MIMHNYFYSLYTGLPFQLIESLQPSWQICMSHLQPLIWKVLCQSAEPVHCAFVDCLLLNHGETDTQLLQNNSTNFCGCEHTKLIYFQGSISFTQYTAEDVESGFIVVCNYCVNHCAKLQYAKWCMKMWLGRFLYVYKKMKLCKISCLWEHICNAVYSHFATLRQSYFPTSPTYT